MQEHATLFSKGALVARDPDRFEHLSELELDEVEALKYERDHKWHGSKMLWYSISLCAVGAATQGWDQVNTLKLNLLANRLLLTTSDWRQRRKPEFPQRIRYRQGRQK